MSVRLLEETDMALEAAVQAGLPGRRDRIAASLTMGPSSSTAAPAVELLRGVQGQSIGEWTILLDQKFKYLRFPGHAGQLQSAGDTAGLMKELGTNYDDYHKFLANALKRLGYDPACGVRGDMETYAARCDEYTEIVSGEIMARQGKAFLETGRVERFVPDDPALIDSRQRLLSVRDGAHGDDPGVAPREPTPCPFPVG